MTSGRDWSKENNYGWTYVTQSISCDFLARILYCDNILRIAIGNARKSHTKTSRIPSAIAFYIVKYRDWFDRIERLFIIIILVIAIATDVLRFHLIIAKDSMSLGLSDEVKNA